LWARAAPRIDVEEWARRAQSRGVLVQPGSRFSFDRRRIPNLRMGFAALDESEIERGVRALRAAL
jgi:GntR family transcriptional regulator / MocR family aminotransferase